MGIEPTSSAWKAEVLPLNYTRSCCLPKAKYLFFRRRRTKAVTLYKDQHQRFRYSGLMRPAKRLNSV